MNQLNGFTIHSCVYSHTKSEENCPMHGLIIVRYHRVNHPEELKSFDVQGKDGYGPSGRMSSGIYLQLGCNYVSEDTPVVGIYIYICLFTPI